LAGPHARAIPATEARLRLDKWLWQARFVKSRALAAALISQGRMRVNGTPVSRPGREIGPGDVLTFALDERIRVVRILALGQRRGPASAAQALYADLDPGAAPPTGLPPTCHRLD